MQKRKLKRLSELAEAPNAKLLEFKVFGTQFRKNCGMLLFCFAIHLLYCQSVTVSLEQVLLEPYQPTREFESQCC